jgi:hypothetical protein
MAFHVEKYFVNISNLNENAPVPLSRSMGRGVVGKRANEHRRSISDRENAAWTACHPKHRWIEQHLPSPLTSTDRWKSFDPPFCLGYRWNSPVSTTHPW